MKDEHEISFERPLADSDRLEVTIQGEGKTTFHPPSGWTLTADDYCQVRRGPLRMYFPVDPDTTRRLKQLKYIVDGRNPLPWTRRLLQWLKRR